VRFVYWLLGNPFVLCLQLSVLEIYGASNDQISVVHQEKSCVLRRRTVLCFDVCIIGCVNLNYDFLLDCLI